MSHCPVRRRHSRTWAALGWLVAVFATAQLGLNVAMDRCFPELRDPEYGYKLARLRSRLTEEPDRPLVLFLGSSRSGLGVRPEVLEAGPAAQTCPPIFFNFSMNGAGPLMELVCLRRLLADGICPRAAFIEVLSPLLHQEVGQGEQNLIDAHRLEWKDLSLLQRYHSDSNALRQRWLKGRLFPWFDQRFCIMNRYAPGWLALENREGNWRTMDRSGWMYYPRSGTPEEYQRGLEHARHEYHSSFDHYQITDVPDRALRELLGLCRNAGVAAALVLMPEGTDFQAMYPPGARAQIDRYLWELSREYAIPVVDARNWSPDRDFFDSHHLLARGARAFTERFGREVLNPFMEGTLSITLPGTGLKAVPAALTSRTQPRGQALPASAGRDQ